MRLEERLSKDTRDKLNKVRRRKRKKNKKQSTELSEWDIKELMGMNRTTYERRGGAIRQK